MPATVAFEMIETIVVDVSIVTERAPESKLVFPATSIVLTVMLWTPSERVETVIVSVPPVATIELTGAAPS